MPRFQVVFREGGAAEGALGGRFSQGYNEDVDMGVPGSGGRGSRGRGGKRGLKTPVRPQHPKGVNHQPLMPLPPRFSPLTFCHIDCRDS